MRVFVAGATGAIGARLVPQLVDRGHEVVGSSRSPENAARLRALGAEPVALDLLDRGAVEKAIAAARPDAIVHQATALAGVSDFKHFDRSFAQTNRLRTAGTDALVAAARLLLLPARPHLVTLSGSGGAHGYWRIEQTLAAEWIERANVRLIHHLGDGADYASFDRNRFMRVPGTRNYKSGRYCQVVHADLTSRAYDVRDLVGRLPDPPADDPRAPKRIRRQHTPPSPGRARIDDPVDRWTPREYFAALCGITEFDDAGKCRCPVHDDPRPSCWVGETPEAGFFCYGCGVGGRVYDLWAALHQLPWGMDLRGDLFRRVREGLHRDLGVPIPARGKSRHPARVTR
jgi:hypothetical protein